MKNVTNAFEKLKGLDAFSSPVSLKINSQSSYKSYFSAFITICIAIAFCAILSTNLNQVLNYQNITTVTKEQKIVNQWKVNSTFRGFSLQVDGMIYQQFITMFKAQLVYFEHRKPVMTYQLMQCEPENWPGIPEAIFKKYKIDQTLCPSVDFNTTFYLEGTYRQQNASFLTLKLNPCDSSSPFCDLFNLRDYIKTKSFLLDGLVVHLFIYDFEISENLLSSISSKINIQSNTILTNKIGERVFIEFQTFRVTTDKGILLTEDLQQIYGNRVGAFSHEPLNYNIQTITTQDSLAILTFTMNSNFKIYERTVKKLLDAISKTGGFFYSVIPVIGVIVATYNTYCCNLLVSKRMFNQTDDQNQRNTEKFSIFIKYTIYSFFANIFSYRINWEDCKQIQFKKKEADCLMEVNSVFKRVQKLQTFISHCIDKNQGVCLLLTQLPSLKQSKLSRYQFSYYQLILGENPGTTINFIRKKQNNFQGSLKKLTKMLKQKQKKIVEKPIENKLEVIQQEIGMESENYLKNQEISPYDYQNSEGFDIFGRGEEKSFKKGKADLQVLDQFLKCFPELEKRAVKIKLSSVYKKVERKFAKCFFNMRSQVRRSLQQRIPIIILIRLMKIIRVLRKEREQQQEIIQSSSCERVQKEKNSASLNAEGQVQLIEPIYGNQARDLTKEN